VVVTSWAWLGTFLTAGMLFGIGWVLLRSHWAKCRGFVAGWVVATAVLVTATVFALTWIGLVVGGEADEGATLLSEYAQEAPFAIDTTLAFALILRRYLPDGDHRTAALYGVAATLVMRVVFIGVITGLLQTFTWLLYLVGVLVVYTGVAFARGGHPHPVDHGDPSARWLTRAVASWGRRTRKNGLAYLPPMVLAVVLLTFEDPLVWPDGGPAFQTVLANILALLPIPVLVPYSEKLLTLVSYLPSGLGVLGGFLGIKIILFALHDNVVPFLNGGEPLAWAPAVSAAVSFVVTAGIVGIMVVASLLRSPRRRNTGHDTAEMAAESTAGLAPPAPANPDPGRQPDAVLRSGPAAPGRDACAQGTAVAAIVVVATALVVVTAALAYRRWVRQRGRHKPHRRPVTAPRRSRTAISDPGPPRGQTEKHSHGWRQCALT
jgi:tellurite resistance protein TerC